MATLQDLEDWLIKITEHTRMTREAVEGRGGSGAAQKKERDDDTFINKLGQKIQEGVGRAVGSALGQARSLAARGTSGTVEQARFDYAMDMLGKQFAAVMLPVIQAMTYGANEIERRMRMMGGSEQNRMMGGIIGAGIGLRVGGPFGALAGYGIGAALGGDSSQMSTEGRAAAIAGSAYAGYRVAGPYGGAAAGTAAAIGTSSDYDRLRRGGQSMVQAGFGTIGMATYDLGHSIFGDGGRSRLDRAREEFDARPWGAAARRAMFGAPGAEPRRDVSPFQAEMMDAGGFAARAQEGVTRATAGEGRDDGGPLKPIVNILLDIFDVLRQINGGRGPAPRPGADGGAGM